MTTTFRWTRGAALLALSMATAAVAQDAGGNKFPLPPAQQPAAGAGEIAVHALQGTPDAPAIGSVPVTVHLTRGGFAIDTINAQLDEFGVVVIEDLRVSGGVVPIVQVEHAGVLYEQIGTHMDDARAKQKIEVTCYEVTEETPPWRITMRHVVLEPRPDAIAVTEVVVVENPTSRSWLGADDGTGHRISTSLRLPDTAREVALGPGFEGGRSTEIVGGTLHNHFPLRPGKTELTFGYTVPAVKGVTSLELVAPVPVGHAMVMVPETVTVRDVAGLEAGGTRAVSGGQMNYFIGGPFEPGQAARLELIGEVVAASALQSDPQGGRSIARLLAAIGSGLLLLIAVVVIIARAPARQGAPPAVGESK